MLRRVRQAAAGPVRASRAGHKRPSARALPVRVLVQVPLLLQALPVRVLVQVLLLLQALPVRVPRREQTPESA